VSRKQFIQFAKEFLSPTGSKRRLLVSQVTAQGRVKEGEGKGKEVEKKGETVMAASVKSDKGRLLSVPIELREVDDEIAFRKSLELL
jgi:hypothetical protein